MQLINMSMEKMLH